jgi:hypothetical protein
MVQQAKLLLSLSAGFGQPEKNFCGLLRACFNHGPSCERKNSSKKILFQNLKFLIIF